MKHFSKLVQQAASSIYALSKHAEQPIESAVILGSGLSDLKINNYELITKISYVDIAGMLHSTAPSHSGELRLMRKDNHTIAVCAGRHHLYEGYSAQQVCMLTYTLAALGAKQLIITNASGALNPDYAPGEVMLINDHINFTGQNPLIGQDEQLGKRFPDMSQAYDKTLIKQAAKIAQQHDIAHHQGIYIGVTGPSLETSAERRMLRIMGADAVGMSTVMEVIAANHAQMNVLGLAAITNKAVGDERQQVDTIEEVLANAAIAGKGIKKIIEGILEY